MNEWIYIDNFDFSQNPDYIFCDTRDFNIIGINANSYSTPPKIPYSSDNLYTITDIKNFLKLLEDESGGKKYWRKISWPHNQSWWKYLRFKKHGDYYLGYCDVGNNIVLPLDKAVCQPSKIIKKDL